MLSIVIPIYNGEKYIRTIFECFSVQETDDFELIFVNDGSTDGSLEELKKCKSEFGCNVNIISKENAGVSVARNAGMVASKGEYVTFIDVDDMIPKNYLEVITDGLKASPEVFAFQSTRVDEDDIDKIDINKAANVEETHKISSSEIIRLMLSCPTNFGVYNVVIRKDFIEKVKLAFPKGYKYYEDYYFLYLLFSMSRDTVFSKTELYYYIRRSGSAMQKFTSDRITCLELIESLNSTVKENVPEVYDEFRKYSVSRIYWSILWQSVLSVNSYKEFKNFYKRTKARKYIKNMISYIDKKVKLSSLIFLVSPRIYYRAVLLLGKSHSKINTVSSN